MDKNSKNMPEEDGSLLSKKEIRRMALSKRDGMRPEERRQKSEMIWQALQKLSCYREAQVLFSYVDYRSEVITTSILANALREGKQVFAPRVDGDEMEFYRITGCQDLRPGYRGIREPIGNRIFEGLGERQRGLLLMPGAAFDQFGHRIGYGKGFYDRYLERMEGEKNKICILALCFEIQIFPQVPWEKHDMLPELILTEERIIEINRD